MSTPVEVCSPAFRRKFVGCNYANYELPPEGRTTNHRRLKLARKTTA